MQTVMEKKENAIVAKVQTALDVQVDKEELIRALQYDRNQYEKGYMDGKADAMAELVRCKDCKFYDGQVELADIAGWTDGEPYCLCEEMMEYVPRKGFCHKGERKDDGKE
jgi:hypothetical protein